MGFFGWSTASRKTKKDSPPVPPKDTRWGPPHHKPRPPPPPSHLQRGWYPSDPYHLPPPQPIGLLPAPPGWVPSPPSSHYQTPGPYPPPIVVNQHHYYLGPPPPGGPPVQHPPSTNPTSKLNLGSVLNLAKEMCPGAGILQKTIDDNVPGLQGCGTQLLNQSAALYDQISDRFNNVMTLIDGDQYKGNEKDLFAWQPPTQAPPHPTSVVKSGEKGLAKTKQKSKTKDQPKGQTTAVAASVISSNFFAKVELYANSKLPLDLPPLRL